MSAVRSGSILSKRTDSQPSRLRSRILLPDQDCLILCPLDAYCDSRSSKPMTCDSGKYTREKGQAALATVSTAKSATFVLVKSFPTWQATRSTTECRANVSADTTATVPTPDQTDSRMTSTILAPNATNAQTEAPCRPTEWSVGFYQNVIEGDTCYDCTAGSGLPKIPPNVQKYYLANFP